MFQKPFYLRNIHENERELLFSLDAIQASCKIATVNGSFEKARKLPTNVITKHNGKASLMSFRMDLESLIHYLKTDYSNGLLSSESAMCNFCTVTSDVPPMVGYGKKVHGFETHSDMYIYYIGCIIKNSGDSEFFINCYDRHKLIELGYIEDTPEV